MITDWSQTEEAERFCSDLLEAIVEKCPTPADAICVIACLYISAISNGLPEDKTELAEKSLQVIANEMIGMAYKTWEIAHSEDN